MIHLRNDLDEISGLCYYPKDTSLFAISDENGVLSKIHLKKPVKIEQWKFSQAGDFEDILLYDTTFYALQSNGNLKAFGFKNGQLANLDVCTLPITGYNEFETIYYDAYNENIVLLCKECEADKHQLISAFSFNPVDLAFSTKPKYEIDGLEIKDILKLKKTKFRPSAAAINPLTKELYIISAVANVLVVADPKGEIKNAYKLDPKFFKQPEGLAFSPSGTLYISNEAAETGNANILVFKYNPSLNEKI
jgi:DNA-binding beta-propeller fold protein YncE